MKLSTRGRYGLKAMVDLALAYGQGVLISTASLAQQQEISEAYLERIIASLRKSGLVTATRGAQGGYILSRSPEEISVFDVLNVLEETTIADCVSIGRIKCKNACSCSARPLWLKLQNRINEVLSVTTLRDMADDYKKQMERTQK